MTPVTFTASITIQLMVARLQPSTIGHRSLASILQARSVFKHDKLEKVLGYMPSVTLLHAVYFS